MKRGFLNSKKGKAAIASEAPASAPTSAARSARSKDDRSQAGHAEDVTRATIEYPKKPDGWVVDASASPIAEAPSSKLDYEDNVLVFTSIPSQNADCATHTDAETRDGWTEVIVDGATKRAIFSQRNFPHPVGSPPTSAHRIGPADGEKGLGVFATRKIKQGELILSERPLVMVPRCLLFIDTLQLATQAQKVQALVEREDLLQSLFRRMLPERCAALWALQPSTDRDESGPIMKRIRKNGLDMAEYTFSAINGPDKQYIALNEDISRANHSCRPNAKYTFHRPSFSSRLRAVRDIKAGEEICISYVPLNGPCAQRQGHLAPYGFNCSCAACADHTVSDERRARISISVVEDEKVPKRQEFERISEQIELLQREGLECLPVYFNNILYMLRLCAQVGEWAKLSTYNEKMMGLSPLFSDGMDEEQAEQLAFLGL